MKRRVFLLLAALLVFCLTACGADEEPTKNKHTEEPTEVAKEPTGEPTPTEPAQEPTAEPTPTEVVNEPSPTEKVSAVNRGSVFTDYSGKTVDEIVANIQAIRTIAAGDTLENYADRFDRAPEKTTIYETYTHTAQYWWSEGKDGAAESGGLISLFTQVAEDNTIALSQGSWAEIMLCIKDESTAKAVYGKVYDILYAEYGAVNEDGVFECWGPENDYRHEDSWITTFGARNISLYWPGVNEDVYTISIAIGLRAAGE